MNLHLKVRKAKIQFALKIHPECHLSLNQN